MKNIAFLALFLATIFQNVQAQVSIGGIAGVNYTNYFLNLDFEDRNVNTPEMNIGYFIGLNSSFALSEKLNILGEFKYAVRGYSISHPDPNFITKFRVNYFELIPKIEFRPLEFIGIALGVNVGKYGGGSSKLGNKDWQNFIREIELFNTNIALTGSIRGYLKNFFIEAGYESSLNDVSDIKFIDINGHSLGNIDSRFRNFNLGIGYLFEL